MGKIAQEVLKEPKPDVNTLVNRIQEYESELWYNPKQKEYGRMASSRPQRYCKGCDSNTHDESACWGVCPHCRDERIFEYIWILEYFPLNINYSNTKIQILPLEYMIDSIKPRSDKV